MCVFTGNLNSLIFLGVMILECSVLSISDQQQLNNKEMFNMFIDFNKLKAKAQLNTCSSIHVDSI